MNVHSANALRPDAGSGLNVHSAVRLAGVPSAGAAAAAVREALAAAGRELVVDLDAAEHLDDEIANVLRRAVAAARASGVAVRFVATRPGPRRWLARHDLERGR
jgi:anti-anti-sigma regulatory factor